MTDQKHYLWFEGQPTAPDVAKLLKAYPELKVGDTITHTEIEKVIGVKWRTSRYSTVATAWRKRVLEDQRLNIDCQPGKGFYVASFEQVAACTRPMVVRAGRAAKRQFKRLAVTEPQLEHQKIEKDHYLRLCESFGREVKKLKMNILPPTAASSVPQILPPAGTPSSSTATST